jgi:hypothetical protein
MSIGKTVDEAITKKIDAVLNDFARTIKVNMPNLAMLPEHEFEEVMNQFKKHIKDMYNE